MSIIGNLFEAKLSYVTGFAKGTISRIFPQFHNYSWQRNNSWYRTSTNLQL